MGLLRVEGFDGLLASSDLTVDGKFGFSNSANVVVDKTGIGANGGDCLRTTAATTITAFLLSDYYLKTLYTALWVFLPAAPTVNQEFITWANSNGRAVSLRWNSGGNIMLRNGASGGGSDVGSFAPPLNQWFFLEVELFCTNASSGTFKARVNGDEVINYTGDTSEWTGALDRITFLSLAATQVRYDDLMIWDASTDTEGPTSWIGPSYIQTYAPAGDGSLSQWTPSEASAHYTLVDEFPNDGDATYVQADSPGLVDLYTFPDLPADVVEVVAVSIDVGGKAVQTPGCKIAARSKSNGVDKNLTPRTKGTGTDTVQYFSGVDPATDAPWTPAAFNAAEFGFERTA